MMDREPLAAGKLPAGRLRTLLQRHVSPLLKDHPELGRRVLVPPAAGEDAAVVLPPSGDGLALVLTSDPITFVAGDLGWYAVHVNANDVAAMGGDPEFLVLVLLLPEGESDASQVDAILADAASACRELGIALVGGHTEVTPAVRRTVAVGQMLGRVRADRILSSARAEPGQDVLMTKGYPVEGVAVMADMAGDRVRSEFGADFTQRCLGFIRDPGISVVADGRRICEAAEEQGCALGAMHDPTEGGLATGLREVAEASGVGLEIDGAALPLLPEGERLCRLLGLEPLGVIASGAMIATCAGGAGDTLARVVTERGTPCRKIGRTTAERGRLIIRRRDREESLPSFAADEVTRLL
ncbi:MAG: hydrogenase expression protein [Candidatus Eisenbacteria bacterium]|nr:hydrogenase expression protein [Candidatus Eisenbacteria bacterium]